MPAIDPPEIVARRQRLREWIDAHYGNDANLIREFPRLAQASSKPKARLAQGELSGLTKVNGKSFGERKARDLEIVLGMPHNHLLSPLDPSPAKLVKITDGPQATNSGAWTAYAKAPRATQAAIDLLLLSPRQRKGLAAKQELIHHLIEQLEQRAVEALKALKSAA